jgi:hypothetical protein
MPLSDQPRVFISYARSDGAKYATWLRRKLEKEHPDITLWHDIANERAGRDWWLQITEALPRSCDVVVRSTMTLGWAAVRLDDRYSVQVKLLTMF